MSQKNIRLIVDLFHEAHEKILRQELATSDLNLFVDQAEASITLSDDNDHILATKVLFDYLPDSASGFKPECRKMKGCLEEAIVLLQTEGYFEQEGFKKPFSVIYSDNSDEPSEEMLFIDDELIRIDDPLLENLDQELDSFIKQLLSE